MPERRARSLSTFSGDAVTTKKAPKPVKAWAVVDKGSGFCFGLSPHRLRVFATGKSARREMLYPNERVIRILVTPLEKP